MPQRAALLADPAEGWMREALFPQAAAESGTGRVFSLLGLSLPGKPG